MREDLVRQEVQRILTNSPDTRADDMVLYYHYVSDNCKKEVGNDSFLTLFANPRYRVENGLPSFATVSRMRRKLQETYEELRPNKEQQAIKKKYEKMYREFYKKPLCLNCE